MDPLSITVACVSLTASIGKTSLAVTTFVRAVRSARGDLDGVGRELASLTTLLELISEDAKDIDSFPKPLRKHISGIITNCELVLLEIQRLIEKYDQPGFIKSSKWALTGSEDVAKLQLSLEAHKSALEIALEMVTLSISREIKNVTIHIKDDTAAIKSDTAEILLEIARLRAQLPDDQVTLRSKTEASESTLAHYLDDLTSYAETVCWSGEDSDTDLENDDPSTVKKSESLSPTISAKAPGKLPPIPEVKLTTTEKQIADIMPPPGYNFGPQSTLELPRPKSTSCIENVDSRAPPSQSENLSQEKSPSRPMDLPRVKTRVSPTQERRLATQKTAPNPRVSAPASTSDLDKLSEQPAIASQAESWEPLSQTASPYTRRGKSIQLEPSPTYYPESITGTFQLSPLPSVSVKSESKKEIWATKGLPSVQDTVLPEPKKEAWVTKGYPSVYDDVLPEPKEEICVIKQDTRSSMHPPCRTQPLPEPTIPIATEISLSDAIDSFMMQAEELRNFADYVQRILEDDLTTSSKPSEMKVRDFAYKVHTLRTKIYNKYSRLKYDVPLDAPGTASYMMVRNDTTYYSQKVQDLYEECSEIERNISQKDMRIVRSRRTDNSSGHDGGLDSSLVPRAPTNWTGLGLFQVRAIHAFESVNKDDLTFKRGEIINVTQDIFRGWYEGHIDGPQSKGTGTFPANYVVALTPAEKPTLFQARAVSSFESEDKDDLTFKKGQIINVTEDFSTWLIGYIDGTEPKQRGAFPTNHVVFDYPGPELPLARVHGLEQYQSIGTNSAIPNCKISTAKPFAAAHRFKWTSRVEANRADITNHSHRDSMATDVNLQPVGQISRSPSIEFASNRDSRNTLTTFPQDWNSYGQLYHAVKDTVTEQRHKGNGEFAVVKTYKRGPNDDKSYKVRIMREAEILGLFSHPHIVHLRYFTRTPDAWLLYLEHAGSTTLTQYLIQHGNYSHPSPMTAQPWGAWDISNEHTTRRFARQIGSALRYCHLNCVHHCNLHSDKIIINDKGNVKLTGFGGLQFISVVDDDSFDTFSYGTILWHMVRGTVPWPVEDNYDRFATRCNASRLVTNSGDITSDCYDLLSGLLNGGKGRLSLKQALDHPWMLVSFGTPVADYMFNRKPLYQIEESIVRKLRLFGFGSPSRLKEGLTNDIQSSPYLAAVWTFKETEPTVVTPEESTSAGFNIRQSLKKGFGETWSKSRAKRASVQEPAPAEVVPQDPVPKFYEEVHARIASPVLSMYNLAKEKLEREQSRLNFDTMSPTLT